MLFPNIWTASKRNATMPRDVSGWEMGWSSGWASGRDGGREMGRNIRTYVKVDDGYHRHQVAPSVR